MPETERPRDQQHRRTALLADAALNARMGQDNAAAALFLAMLGRDDTEQYPSIANAMIYWVELLRDHMFGGLMRAGKVNVSGASMYRVTDGAEFVLGSAQADMEVEPMFQWAGQVVRARLERDEAAFGRLWDEAPSEVGMFGQYVVAVMDIVAQTIKAEKRGYALATSQFRARPAE